MKDLYYIVWEDEADYTEILECGSQGECEKELDSILGDGNEVLKVIVGKELSWKTHISTELKEMGE